MLGVIAGVLLGTGIVAVAGVSTTAIVLLLVIGLAAGRLLVASASALALAGEGCSREVAAARELMAEFQRDDSRPVTAILRRPLVLLLDELAGPPA
ncbi:MAG TPA: hypothetical protein VFD90_21235 [Gaiellales bacterium]|jgi:F0F1-type ATP synthase assembly protein I|nr:hypothetical protein [Gaiellales bacterium]